MPAKLHSISIHNFRSFADLAVSGLGGVTLVTGKNNVGKSTLLEAIRILTTDAAPATLFGILNYREESDPRLEEPLATVTPDDYVAFCSLFRNFPNLAACRDPFVIAGADKNGNPIAHVTAKMRWFAEKTDDEQSVRRLVPTEPDLFGDESGFPALDVELLNRRRVIRIDRDRPMRYRRSWPEANEGLTAPCIFLDPFSSRSTNQLAALWDSVALTAAEQDVVEALKIAAPEIEAVSMIGSDAGSHQRTAIARSAQYSHPVPLRSFGDGVNRLFGLMLSLSCGRNGFLLVDEIENGLHHTILADVWRTTFRVARKLNVQVFATTHSWDCIEAFQKAAADDPEEGVLLKLVAKQDRILTRVFKEDELAIATRDQIELR